jgi:hypothetical protein
MSVLASQTEYTIRTEFYKTIGQERALYVDASHPYLSIDRAHKAASLQLLSYIDDCKRMGTAISYKLIFHNEQEGWIRFRLKRHDAYDPLLCRIWIEEEEVYWYLHENMDKLVWDRHRGDDEEKELFAGDQQPIVRLPPLWRRKWRREVGDEEKVLLAPLPENPRPIVRLPPPGSRSVLNRHDSHQR